MAEAPHGTAPALQGKDIANPMAMILVLRGDSRPGGAARRARGRSGVARDLRGDARGHGGRHSHARPRRAHATTEVTDEVIARIRGKLEVWDSLGATL